MKYKSPTTPMSHQVEYHRRLKKRPSKPSSQDVMALLAEMGTGKTKMILDEWQERVNAKDLTDLFVIGPAGAYKNWFMDKSEEQPSEMKVHLDPELFKKTLVLPWIGGAKARDMIRYGLVNKDKRPRALFMNVEAFSTSEKAFELAQMFLHNKRSLMVIDESTRIKNSDADRTENILSLGDDAPARRIMTGMVTPRSPMDLFTQFQFLDWKILGFESYYGFRARYAVLKQMDIGGRKFKIIVGYRNLDELQQKIAPYSYRVLKSECLDLEPKIYEFRDVELTDEQRRIYKEIKETATAAVGDLPDHVVTKSVIDQMIRLHQVACGYVKDEEGKIHDIKSNRIKAILEILEEHGGKAIIWSSMRHEITKIAEALRKEYDDPRVVAEFHGGNKSTRGEEEKRFLGDPACRFMISTQAAGGTGNTWNVADLTIYASNNHDLELRAQSEDRNHRKGQKKSVTYVDLRARGTVEEKIIASLRAKIDMATAITGENYREWLI